MQDAGCAPIVPVVNCPRRDFVLRTETVFLVATLGVDLDALLIIDIIDLEALRRAGRLALSLLASCATMRVERKLPMVLSPEEVGRLRQAAPG